MSIFFTLLIKMPAKLGKFVKKKIDDSVYIMAKIDERKGKFTGKRIKQLRDALNDTANYICAPETFSQDDEKSLE